MPISSLPRFFFFLNNYWSFSIWSGISFTSQALGTFWKVWGLSAAARREGTVAHPLPVQACITISDRKRDWGSMRAFPKHPYFLFCSVLFWGGAHGRGVLTSSESLVILGCAGCREQLGGRRWFLWMVYLSFVYISHAQFSFQQFSVLIPLGWSNIDVFSPLSTVLGFFSLTSIIALAAL